jgi:predicted ArsR family transcriptional regulator
MYDVDFASLLETSPRPYHTLAAAFASTTGRGIDTRIVQKMLKKYEPETILHAIQCMGDRDVEKPVPYLMGILRNREHAEFNQQRLEEKFQSVIDKAKEPREKLRIRNPFDARTTE